MRKLISRLFLVGLIILCIGAAQVVVRQLNDLTDVGIKTPSANQVLTYVNGQWTNGTVTATSTNTSFYAKGTLVNGGNITDSATSAVGVNGTNVTINPTNLPATLITSGTLSDSRLSTNVALLNANGVYTGSNTYSGPSVFSSFATLKEQSAPGSPSPTNTVQLYAFDVSGTASLRVLDDVGDILVPAYLNAIQIWSEAQTFNGPITLGPGMNITYPDNVRNTFNPGATVAGLNVGSQAGNPSTTINGDLWYDSTANLLKTKVNSTVTSLGDTFGAASSTDNAIARFDSTTGKVIQNSAVIISDLSDITGANSATFSNTVTLTSIGANKVLTTGSGGAAQGTSGSDGTVLNMQSGAPTFSTIGNSSLTDIAWSKVTSGENSATITNSGAFIFKVSDQNLSTYNGNNVSQNVALNSTPELWTVLTNNTTFTLTGIPSGAQSNRTSRTTLWIYNPSTFTGTFVLGSTNFWLSKITPTITTNGWFKAWFDWNGTNVVGQYDGGATNAQDVAYGGTGTNTLVANGVLYGNAANPVQSTAQGAANSVLTANAGAPSFSQSPTINNAVQVGVASSQTGVLKLANASTANITSFAAGNAASALHYIWPTAAPTANQVLSAAAPSGTNVAMSWATATGGSSFDVTDNTKYYWRETFTPLFTDGDRRYGDSTWTLNRITSGGIDRMSAEVGHPGGWRFFPEADVTDALFLSPANFDSGELDNKPYIFGTNSPAMTVKMRVRVTQQIDGTNDEQLRMGFTDLQAAITNRATNCIIFQIDRVADTTQWGCVTSTNSTATVGDSNTNFDTNWVNLAFTISQHATQVVYSINSTAVATNTTNIPWDKQLRFSISGHYVAGAQTITHLDDVLIYEP